MNKDKEYTIEFDQITKKQLKKLEKSGKQLDLKKVFSFLQEIKINPKTGTGHPKPLRNHQGEIWSRKINDKDRFVYKIFEEETAVLVTQVIGHYQDK